MIWQYAVTVLLSPTVCCSSCWLQTPKAPVRGRKCCLKRKPSPQIWWRCGTLKESSSTLPSSMVTTPIGMAQGMDIACHLRTSWQDLLYTFTALLLLSRGMVYIGQYTVCRPMQYTVVSTLVHWSIHCTLANMLYTGQCIRVLTSVHCTLAIILYTGQYTVHWPMNCTLANTLYTGQYTLHWRSYCKLANTLYTGQCTGVPTSVHCTLAILLYSGQYTVHWPVHCTLANILYTGHHTVHWPVHCTLTIILYTGQYTVHWPSYCKLANTLYTG